MLLHWRANTCTTKICNFSIKARFSAACALCAIRGKVGAGSEGTGLSFLPKETAVTKAGSP